jgi:hypothetical protein
MMLSLELSPDEVETALAEWLRLQHAAETGQSQYTLDMQQHAAQ